jgi:hypothetical protein
MLDEIYFAKMQAEHLGTHRRNAMKRYRTLPQFSRSQASATRNAFVKIAQTIAGISRYFVRLSNASGIANNAERFHSKLHQPSNK